MELRQLKYFLKAKELLNFTEAARAVFVTQSTLSQQIKQLEEELGTPLFNRIGRRITLTEAGTLFASYASKSLRLAEDGRLALKELDQLQTGEISIGVSFGLQALFNDVLKVFASKYKDIRIKVIYGAALELFQKLENLELDFILAFHETEELESLKYEMMFVSPLVFVCNKNSKFADRSSIEVNEIANESLVLASRGYSVDHIISREFQKYHLMPKFSLEINDIPTVISLVESGEWSTILVKSSFSNDNLIAIPINGGNFSRTAKFVTVKDIYEKKAVRTFILLFTDLLSKKRF
ncbi:LysR substrate-binding domain-containing protein [Flavobacterium sp. '19STA2R22 D10 B1']|uniref:LysR substrate-binding domain-containing protein n=1 Tax=Flavobacterium aerium TaxID=3037261 RepID=UPI00278C7B69|nr:LysR substrate-binding domain-containing protein [Flavobacterium sp. '19STA2R22 D10 B1']